VRDVPEDVVATSRRAPKHAASRSRPAYVTCSPTRPPATIDEIMANIATRTPVNYNADNIRPLIEDGRR
jgi:hypothetical protein